MASFCNNCGAPLGVGAAFCGGCGKSQAITPNTAAMPSSATSNLPWIVALIAVLLLGVAGGYIFLQRKGHDAPVAAPAATNSAATASNPATTPAPVVAPPVTAPASTTPTPAANNPSAAITVARGRGGVQPIGRYTAYIGQDDLYASDGVRLSQPWQILRQDRANVHRFGISQPGDTGDAFFAQAGNRAIMERMVMNGSISPAAARSIVAGGATVSVTIYGEGSNGRYLDIQVN